MELLKTHNTAIEFLEDENKTFQIEVLDYLDEDDLFSFNKRKRGAEFIKVSGKELDWDEFYFEIDMEISFNYESYHQSWTMDAPEEREIDFFNIESDIEISVCQKWNEEDGEYEDYYLTASEKKEIIKYFEKHLELT